MLILVANTIHLLYLVSKIKWALEITIAIVNCLAKINTNFNLDGHDENLVSGRRKIKYIEWNVALKCSLYKMNKIKEDLCS